MFKVHISDRELREILRLLHGEKPLDEQVIEDLREKFEAIVDDNIDALERISALEEISA